MTEAEGAVSSRTARRSLKQEYTVVAILALGFGLVGIDRFLIVTMFPVIAKDLALSYEAIGLITGALSVAWGLSALFMGNLADRIGPRPVMIASLIVFSSLIGASGLATGLLTLVLVRVIMGIADGAYTPASIAATFAVSGDSRRGLNIGIQQMSNLLLGLGLGPLMVTALLHVLNWRYVFLVFAPPGFLAAYLIWRISTGKRSKLPSNDVRSVTLEDYKQVVSYRNIRLLMVLMLAWLTTLISVSAFFPNYAMEHLGLDFGQMGKVMSAIGFGGATGVIILPALSDRVGRKPVLIGATILALLSIVALSEVGGNVPQLFACLFVAMGCVMSLITLTVGLICDETVPTHLSATASGVIIAVGEVLGGGLAPVLVGRIASSYGINHILWVPIAALVAALPLGAMILETHRPQRHRDA